MCMFEHVSVYRTYLLYRTGRCKMFPESYLLVLMLAVCKSNDIALALNNDEVLSHEAMQQVLEQSQECAIITMELASNTIMVCSCCKII